MTGPDLVRPVDGGPIIDLRAMRDELAKLRAEREEVIRALRMQWGTSIRLDEIWRTQGHDLCASLERQWAADLVSLLAGFGVRPTMGGVVPIDAVRHQCHPEPR